MIKNHLEISPRQCGKTTRLKKIIEELIKNNKKIVLVCKNYLFANNFEKIFGKKIDILSFKDSLDEFGNCIANTTRFDAYKNSIWIYDEFDFLRITSRKEIYLKIENYYSTTPAFTRTSKNLFDFIRKNEYDVLLDLVGLFKDFSTHTFINSDRLLDFFKEYPRDVFNREMLGEFI